MPAGRPSKLGRRSAASVLRDAGRFMAKRGVELRASDGSTDAVPTDAVLDELQRALEHLRTVDRPPRKLLADVSEAIRGRTVLVKVCRAIRVGAYLDAAAAAGGVSRSTLIDWVRRGERDLTEDRDTVMAEFKFAYDLATSDAEIIMLETIHAAATHPDPKIRDWKAAAWRLERKSPARWGKQEARLTPDVPDQEPEDLTRLSTDELRIYKRLREKACGEVSDLH